MQKRQIIAIILIVITVVVLGMLFWWFQGRQNNEVVIPPEDLGVKGTAIDVTLDFYESWLSARISTTTDPYKEGFSNSAALSETMSKRLADSEISFRGDGFDPVLCQSSVPNGVRSKAIFEKEGEAQILVFPRDKQVGMQAVVTLAGHDGFWKITDISCGSGEQSPDSGEFSFDKDGYLLKGSVPAPLDSKYWHLVFEQEGVSGHTVPLYFSETSICVNKEKIEEICRDNMFVETMRIHIQGDATEAGIEVKRIEFLE